MQLQKALAVASVLSVVSVAPSVSPARADDAASKPKPLLASLWSLPTEAGSLALLASGRADPAVTSVAPGTRIGGMCQHCGIQITCKASDVAGSCPVCGCGISSARCIFAATPKPEAWPQLLSALPKGTGLQVTYAEPNKPESGLKALTVDLTKALVPVDGLGAQDAARVLPLVKSLGATKVEMTADGKQMAMTLRSPWTADKLAKLDKALATIGAKLAYPANATAKQ